MFQKPREFPVILKQEEALLRSLSSPHKKRDKIERNLKNNRAGYRGELELDYHLKFLPEQNYLIFPNLRLAYQNETLQMDTLVLSPWFAVIIESKNIFGHLYFDPVSKQLIRTFNDQKDGFPDPILQVNRQAIRFKKWVSEHINKTFPVYTLVSIGYPSTIVETKEGNEHVFEKVLHAEHIPQKILEFPQSQQHLSTYQLRKLTELLLNAHVVKPQTNILKQYSIDQSELKIGIRCPHCTQLSMKRIHARWSCPHCKKTSKDAHVQVVEDYILIYGSVTNEQCRELLGLTSIHTTKRILNAMKLRTEGKYKGTVYYL